MTDNLSQYVARNTRHYPSDGAELAIEVRRSAGTPRSVDAQLLDFSRDGFRLQLPSPLVVNESVEVQMRDLNSTFDVTMEATVKWQRTENGDAWLVGLRFEEQADWETMGELFLNGILTMDD